MVLLDHFHPPLSERLSEPVPLADDANAVDRMKHRLRTAAGREVYAQRTCTVEPTFGIIKSVLGFRQFLLRGRQAVQHEWTLVCIGWNLKLTQIFKIMLRRLQCGGVISQQKAQRTILLGLVLALVAQVDKRHVWVRPSARKTPLQPQVEFTARPRLLTIQPDGYLYCMIGICLKIPRFDDGGGRYGR